MANKTIIRLTESDLHNIIMEAAKKVINGRKLRSDETATTQLGLFQGDKDFDTTETKITRPKRVSPAEKEKRKQAKKEDKDAEWIKKQEEDFKNKQKKWGVKQLEFGF